MKDISLPSRDEPAWNTPPEKLGNGSHVISKHQDVIRALKDRHFASRLLFAPAEARPDSACPWMRFKHFFRLQKSPERSPHQTRDMLRNSIAFLEAGEHDRLQRPIKRVFLNRLQAVQANLAAAAEESLTTAERAFSVDWMEAVIKPYIASNIAALCDFPPDIKPEPDLCEWFDPLEELFSKNPNPSQSRYEAFLKAVHFFEQALSSPHLEKSKGFIAEMARLSGEPACFSRDEICSNILSILMAANHSSRQVIAGSLRILITRPDLLRQLQDNPALVPSATQEFLRLNVPLKMLQRQVTEDVRIAGVDLKEGEWLYLDVTKANNDPEIFETPDEIRFDRATNPHVTFGSGTHICLGAPMARMQIEAFLSAFVQKSLHFRFELVEAESEIPDKSWLPGKIHIRCQKAG